jgi:hypothetical protein
MLCYLFLSLMNSLFLSVRCSILNSLLLHVCLDVQTPKEKKVRKTRKSEQGGEE